MMTKGTSKYIPGITITIAMLLSVTFFFVLPNKADANDQIDLIIHSVPAQPAPVADVLEALLADTIADVLFDCENSHDLLESDPVALAEAIRTGLNIVIEPKGYQITDLDLNLESDPPGAELTVRPVMWTEDNPRAVTDVAVSIDPGNLDAFWITRLSDRLADAPEVSGVYRQYLLGLPTHAVDTDWALQIVLPYIFAEDPAHAVFRDYAIFYDVTIDSTAIVTLSFEPRGDLIERIRPRMYSLTLLNVLMDRFRERLFAEADFIEGMPRAEILMAAEDIEARLSDAITNDPLARDLNAYASVIIQDIENEPVILIDAVIESRTFDMSLETFIDFGNEARDSTEIQARAGYLLTRGIEVFTQLNYFTNDSELKTDVGLGLRPHRGSFVGIGYDLDREFWKYFVDQELYPGLNIRAEIFEDDEFNEFGMIYQFQQYIAGGAFTNGDNEFWVRAIFAL